MEVSCYDLGWEDLSRGLRGEIHTGERTSNVERGSHHGSGHVVLDHCKLPLHNHCWLPRDMDTGSQGPSYEEAPIISRRGT